MVGWFFSSFLRGFLTHGPLIGIIWDPSPEIQNHVHPFELLKVKLGLTEEAGSDRASPRGRRQTNATSDRIEQRAMFPGALLDLIDGVQNAEIFFFVWHFGTFCSQ